MIGYAPFALWIRANFIPKWTELCGAAGMAVPQVLTEDPATARPVGNWLLLSTVKGDAKIWRWVYPAGVQAARYRYIGRIQGDLHLTAGSGPAPAERYADIWRAAWEFLTTEGVRPAGVRFYTASGASEQGSTGTHAVWVMDVPFRYDEL